MISVVKGDEYILPVKIMQGLSPLTPTDVTDVRIQIANMLKTYSEGELTFDTETNEWNYPLTQEQTFAFGNEFVKIQVGVKIGDNIIYAQNKLINISENIITKEW